MIGSSRRKASPTSPQVEAVEPRTLMSVTPLLALGAVHRAAVAHADAAAPGGAIAPISTGQPTAKTLAKERFTAASRGKFLVGRGQFTDQSRQYLIIGEGSSNASLHVQVVLKVFTPTDPSKPVTGTATIIPRNVSSTGSILVLDLSGSASDVDGAGRPTRLNWVVDGNSGGLFTQTANTAGQANSGTLQIDYLNGSVRPHRGLSDGVALTRFDGLIYLSGVSNIIGYNVPRI
jgi:hypothetical protein